MFLLLPAHPGCPGQRAVKGLLLYSDKDCQIPRTDSVDPQSPHRLKRFFLIFQESLPVTLGNIFFGRLNALKPVFNLTALACAIEMIYATAVVEFLPNLMSLYM